MLKYVDSKVTFAEFPDEIALCLSISNCPNYCKNCSSSFLAEDIGTELTFEILDGLIIKNKGITLVGFLGGDSSIDDIKNFTKYIHERYALKVGMYSGRDYLDYCLAGVLDYYKIGRWISFEGPEETWKNQTAGPLCLPTSNQVMFKRENNKLINITEKFRKFQINNWKSAIL